MSKLTVQRTKGERKTQFNMRTTEIIRNKLQEAANLSGRTLTAEAEYRLIISFEWERAFKVGERAKSLDIKASLENILKG